ncbi:hypothetical protein T05_4126 [Trichinella murrelli]|uniref:Uncharacterized protein n=2 Tax=Trichinella murrelli TaxID=144512 RepID=A0A0V0T953_9BILA|nr:hypothetical protein T05_4126 [Trichinella murrelli]
MQQYKDSEQSDVRTWRSLHLIHSCGKLITELEVNSHLTSFEEKRSAKEASPQEEEIQTVKVLFNFAVIIPLFNHYSLFHSAVIMDIIEELDTHPSRLIRTQALEIRMNTITLLHSYPLLRLEDMIRNVTIYQV